MATAFELRCGAANVRAELTDTYGPAGEQHLGVSWRSPRHAYPAEQFGEPDC